MMLRRSSTQWIGWAYLALAVAFGLAQSSQPSPSPSPIPAVTAKPLAKTASQLETLLEANVKTEWDAFKNRDKTAYSNLLADDFVAIEDDGQGTRNRNAAIAEVDHSVVSKYYLFAFHALPLDANAALVTYELTMEFPLQSAARVKRVLVSEIWIKRNGQWKMRYYQETRTR